MCSTVYRLYALYDYFESDLAAIFDERLKSKKYFEEEELMNILSCVARSLIYIQDNGLKNSFLTKQSILCVSGRYIVLDAIIAARHHPYYSLLMGETLSEDVF